MKNSPNFLINKNKRYTISQINNKSIVVKPK